MSYLFNMLPSPDDHRDHIYTTKLQSIPSKLDYRKELLTVRNQGGQGSCFAFASSSMKEFQEKMNYGCDFYLSPQYVYNLRWNLYDEKKTNDEGMYGRDGMKILFRYGICSEQAYPYGKEVNTLPSDNLREEALNHTIKEYAKVNTIADLKEALYTNGPCIICVPVYNHTTRMWKPATDKETRIGGHAMCVVGYDKNGFIIRNSWGSKWGEEGHTTFPYEDWGSQYEVWTCVDNELSKRIIKKKKKKRLC